MFEEVMEACLELGLIKRRGKMRTDSTHMIGVVERLSQLELVTESLRVALEAIDKVGAPWLDEQVPDSFINTYAKRQSDYGLSEVEVRAKLEQAGRDGFWLLGQVSRCGPEAVRRLEELAVLGQVLSQQFPQGEGGAPASRRPLGRQVIESPHETQVRRAYKREQGWTGYKVQVTETRDEGYPRLIADVDVTCATDHDSTHLEPIRERLVAQDTLPGEHHVDQAYVSAEHIVESEAQGIELVGPVALDTASPPGYRQADFAIDEVAKEAVCPQGKTSCVWSERGQGEGAGAVQVRFGAADCLGCSAFGQCTHSDQGRTLELHRHRQVLVKRRVLMEDEDYRQRLRVRAGIEATISEMVRGHGLRHARYRGRDKVLLQSLFTGLAVNLKRLARFFAASGAQAAQSQAA